MVTKSKTISIAPKGADYTIHILGDQPHPVRDFYHGMLRLTWPRTFLAIALAYLFVNALFAFCYLVAGGVANAAAGSFADAFYFSVETMGTIGYGAMYPASTAANVIMVIESIVSLVLTALATGLVFAKFSRPTARVRFTKHAVIAPMNGVPTLMLRLGNERGNQIVDAQFRVVCMRTEQTVEGPLFYRMIDLQLVRERAPSLQRSFSVLHVIDEKSPFFGQTPESIAEQEYELQVMVVGLDDTSMQVMHANHRYFAAQIMWGARHRDILSEQADGSLVLDLTKFHDHEPTLPTPTFPYPSP